MSRILVCGGRTFADADLLAETLAGIFRPGDVLVHGGALGADLLAARWALSRDVAYEGYPAWWDKHGRAAGAIRNQRMLETGIDLVVAFPGGSGTADMVRRAKRAGVRVIEVRLPG